MSLLQKYADFLDENEELKKENAELRHALEIALGSLCSAAISEGVDEIIKKALKVNSKNKSQNNE